MARKWGGRGELHRSANRTVAQRPPRAPRDGRGASRVHAPGHGRLHRGSGEAPAESGSARGARGDRAGPARRPHTEEHAANGPVRRLLRRLRGRRGAEPAPRLRAPLPQGLRPPVARARVELPDLPPGPAGGHRRHPRGRQQLHQHTVPGVADVAGVGRRAAGRGVLRRASRPGRPVAPHLLLRAGRRGEQHDLGPHGPAAGVQVHGDERRRPPLVERRPEIKLEIGLEEDPLRLSTLCNQILRSLFAYVAAAASALKGPSG
mmetsp:Transcript_51085/g.143829  ORF Transcript_51085/g.143829 Transcript_51085/m.143829 type:complete len:262 (+) Transcript_51085:243-1028(+)